MIHQRTHCRACGSKNLALVLDLGKTPLANDFVSPEKISTCVASLPLRLCVCQDCTLAQLADVVNPEVLYGNYAYITSTSRTMDVHLTGQCQHLLKVGGFAAPPRVLEIASNTGIYLKKFQDRGCEVVGIEPAENISELAVRHGIPTRTEFFGRVTAAKIRQEWGQADLIVGRHVFAHIDDLQDLLAGLEQIAHPGTVIAFEVPYLVDFFKGIEFDTVYHEHMSYISVQSLAALVAHSPFFLHRVDRYPIHGGSILFHFRLRGCGVAAHESVARMLAEEERLNLASPAAWEPFEKSVRRIQADLPALVRRLRAAGKRVIGYGASAKGNTLLNCCGLTAKDLDYIIDNTPFKQNKVAPGSWIPVQPPELLMKDKPDYSLLLAWNFATEIVQREVEYQKAGGRFILPIPEVRVLDWAGGAGSHAHDQQQ